MSIHFTQGDLFLTGAQTVAHGCNTKGRMGAGVAVEIKRRFPEVFPDYRKRCKAERFRPGDIQLYKECQPWVLNLATQDSLSGARLEYLQKCFSQIAKSFEQLQITSIAMPMVGAGLGGLDEDSVINVMKEQLDSLPIPIIVYDNFIPNKEGNEPLG